MDRDGVLIVGAGPTGLAMAIEMRRLGVPFRLIDRSLHQAKYSQALVVQARTLEQFERYGIARLAVRKQESSWAEVRRCWRSGRTGTSDFAGVCRVR